MSKCAKPSIMLAVKYFHEVKHFFFILNSVSFFFLTHVLRSFVAVSFFLELLLFLLELFSSVDEQTIA